MNALPAVPSIGQNGQRGACLSLALTVRLLQQGQSTFNFSAVIKTRIGRVWFRYRTPPRLLSTSYGQSAQLSLKFCRPARSVN